MPRAFPLIRNNKINVDSYKKTKIIQFQNGIR